MWAEFIFGWWGLVEKVHELTHVLGDSLVPSADRRTSQAVTANALLRGSASLSEVMSSCPSGAGTVWRPVEVTG